MVGNYEKAVEDANTAIKLDPLYQRAYERAGKATWPWSVPKLGRT